MKRKNEINACNALIRILERVAGVKYECENCPDEGASKEKEPDFILKSTCVGMTRMAVEHTVIPAGLRGYAIWSYERAEEINRLCQRKIQADRYYYISAPHALINSLTDKKRQKAFHEALAPWITQHAPQLRIDESKQYSYQCYKITLTCGGTHPRLNGTVGRMPECPADVTTFQKEAFDTAIRHGLDKLRKYKCNPSESFETVLLLEDVFGLQHQRITKGLTSSEKAQISEYIDYIVVLQSNQDQMIVGNVWKENETWHGFIPANRRFSRDDWLADEGIYKTKRKRVGGGGGGPLTRVTGRPVSIAVGGHGHGIPITVFPQIMRHGDSGTVIRNVPAPNTG